MFLAVLGNPVAKKPLLHFASGTPCDRNFIFASGESQDAQTNGNTEA
jgi:hypothetical protein